LARNSSDAASLPLALVIYGIGSHHGGVCCQVVASLDLALNVKLAESWAENNLLYSSILKRVKFVAGKTRLEITSELLAPLTVHYFQPTVQQLHLRRVPPVDSEYSKHASPPSNFSLSGAFAADVVRCLYIIGGLQL
jgi:hypothetical protein